MKEPPKPKVDHPPAAPGGVDAIDESPDDFLATPDPPISAQLTGSGISDQVQGPEDHDEEQIDSRDGPAEPSA